MATIKRSNCSEEISDGSAFCPISATLLMTKENQASKPDADAPMELNMPGRQLLGLGSSAILFIGAFYANHKPSNRWEHELFSEWAWGRGHYSHTRHRLCLLDSEQQIRGDQLLDQQGSRSSF